MEDRLTIYLDPKSPAAAFGPLNTTIAAPLLAEAGRQQQRPSRRPKVVSNNPETSAAQGEGEEDVSQLPIPFADNNKNCQSDVLPSSSSVASRKTFSSAARLLTNEIRKEKVSAAHLHKKMLTVSSRQQQPTEQVTRDAKLRAALSPQSNYFSREGNNAEELQGSLHAADNASQKNPCLFIPEGAMINPLMYYPFEGNASADQPEPLYLQEYMWTDSVQPAQPSLMPSDDVTPYHPLWVPLEGFPVDADPSHYPDYFAFPYFNSETQVGAYPHENELSNNLLHSGVNQFPNLDSQKGLSEVRKRINETVDRVVGTQALFNTTRLNFDDTSATSQLTLNKRRAMFFNDQKPNANRKTSDAVAPAIDGVPPRTATKPSCISRQNTEISVADTAVETIGEYDDLSVSTLLHVDTSTPDLPPSHPPPPPPSAVGSSSGGASLGSGGKRRRRSSRKSRSASVCSRGSSSRRSIASQMSVISRMPAESTEGLLVVDDLQLQSEFPLPSGNVF